jgi:hypothetical protein
MMRFFCGANPEEYTFPPSLQTVKLVGFHAILYVVPYYGNCGSGTSNIIYLQIFLLAFLRTNSGLGTQRRIPDSIHVEYFHDHRRR